MTREEILEMPAGRELDELVAIKVMGKIDNKTLWGHKPFMPSTDISAAWEVVEKMKQEFRVDLVIEEGSNYCAILGYGDDNGHIYEAGADTAPEAICKACLLAVKEESL